MVEQHWIIVCQLQLNVKTGKRFRIFEIEWKLKENCCMQFKVGVNRFMKSIYDWSTAAIKLRDAASQRCLL